MSSETPELFSREELMGGLRAKRASMLLFAIEARTAHLVMESQQAVARYITEKAAEARERAFLDALAEGRDLPVQPTIQQLESSAREWAHLVPPDPALRAAIANLISQKHIFTHRAVPMLRHALGLDTDAVKQQYEQRYGSPLDDIYAPHVSRLERIRWIWSSFAYRLDNLPPFWMIFALTVTETVGASILALPIALAQVGPMAGVVQLVLLGVVNVVTIAALAEAVARNGSVRYGNTFFGRLVNDYFGGLGSLILSVALLALSFVVLAVYFVGVSSTLAGATGIPAAVWIALLFLVQLYFMHRESLSATIASALLVGGINIGLIVILSLLTLPHVRLENLTYVNLPFLNGQPFNPSLLGLVFGVILSSYFGHTSTGSAARVVLSRDPSGRSLILGAASAMVLAIVVNCSWVIVVNGAVSPAILARQSGTALTPLASQVGPLITVFGLAFVTLGMGMGSIQFALALFNQVREWLPEPRDGDDDLDPIAQPGLAGALHRFVAQPAGQFWLGVAPVAFVFVVIEWLVLNKEESFTAPLSVLGVLAVPLLAGIFPVLMLAASRRKGDYVPSGVVRWLGHPLLMAAVYLLFLSSIFVHGLIIWDDPFRRVLAIAIGILILVASLIFARRGAFTPRAIVEVRVERNPEELAFFNVTVNGKLEPADIRLRDAEGERDLRAAVGALGAFAQLRSATFQLRLPRVHELKVWAHQITPQGTSQGLPASILVESGNSKKEFSLEPPTSAIVLPAGGELCTVRFSFS